MNNIDLLLDYLPTYFQCLLRRNFYKFEHSERFKYFYRMRSIETSNGYSYEPYLKYKTIFVHIPKCAGVSICKALFGNLAGGHTDIKEYQVTFTPQEFKSFFKFTIVRNPWDRLLSAYNFFKNGGFDDRDKEWAEVNLSKFNDFNSFVEQWVNEDNIYQYHHFRPQHSYVCILDRIAVDFVGRFESLQRDYEYISRRIGVNNRLEHINKGQNDKYRSAYSHLSVEIVKRVYAKDIELFGYTFDD